METSKRCWITKQDSTPWEHTKYIGPFHDKASCLTAYEMLGTKNWVWWTEDELVRSDCTEWDEQGERDMATVTMIYMGWGN